MRSTSSRGSTVSDIPAGAAMIASGDVGSGFGTALTTLDADGDGVDDMLIGAPSDDTMGSGSGWCTSPGARLGD